MVQSELKFDVYFILLDMLIIHCSLEVDLGPVHMHDRGNWAAPLSEISAHRYFPIKNHVAFIWVDGLAN